jgi:D-alanyl-D-alanine carboxypeptidase/D-alanyl-D-alanine-endopeptidase (penicillin-binding protein 4)
MLLRVKFYRATEQQRLSTDNFMTKNSRTNFLLLTAFAFAFLLLGFAIAFFVIQKRNNDETIQPITVSNSTADIELARKIDQTINQSKFAMARWGVCVMSLRDGRVVYGRDAQKSFFPASNMKLITTAAALDLLGADYRWRTSVYVEKNPDADGTIVGDIFLYGRGAVDLDSNSLNQLADEIYKRGVRRVKGDVVGDESFFRGDALGEGWLWNDAQWFFGAEASALSINDNEVKIIVTPTAFNQTANATLQPKSNYIQLNNETKTIEGNKVISIGIHRGLSNNDVRVWGGVPANSSGLNARLSVYKPALWAAQLFRDALKAKGISIEGNTRTLDAQDRQAGKGFDLQNATELAYIESQTLNEVVRKTNKESWNLAAELMLRTIGQKFGNTAPDPEPKKMAVRGDDGAGAAVLKKWLGEKGIPTNGLSLHDGSGLSRLSLITPESLTRLLVFMTRHSSAQIFKDSLPIAGQDGTLSYRFKNSSANGRIFAKTGTLTHISALSGYATASNGETFAFSIICNDETQPEDSIGIIDEIAALLVNFSV